MATIGSIAVVEFRHGHRTLLSEDFGDESGERHRQL
jgi:hypothetical protein